LPPAGGRKPFAVFCDEPEIAAQSAANSLPPAGGRKPFAVLCDEPEAEALPAAKTGEPQPFAIYRDDAAGAASTDVAKTSAKHDFVKPLPVPTFGPRDTEKKPSGTCVFCFQS
jgi:hypothetical protein